MNGRITATLCASFLLAMATAAQAEPGWEKIDEEDGTKVYSKDVPGSDVVAFKGEAVVRAPLAKVLWVIMDNDRRTEWVDRLEKSVVLETVSPTEYVYYQHYSLPWPMDDRDYVFRGTGTRDPSGKVTLFMTSCSHPKAPQTVGVRAHLSESTYTLTPLGKGKGTKVVVEIHTDPRGSIPTWLVNLVQEDWPVETLTGIRNQVKRSHVRAHPLPPVREAVVAKTKRPAARDRTRKEARRVGEKIRRVASIGKLEPGKQAKGAR